LSVELGDRIVESSDRILFVKLLIGVVDLGRAIESNVVETAFLLKLLCDRRQAETMQNVSTYPPRLVYYTEDFRLSILFRVICRIFLPIHLKLTGYAEIFSLITS
jgi:hypothetical protein